MGPEKAVFVPRGVANGYQALEPDTAYSCLVNEHWSPQARASYTYLNLADETVGIDWPIPLSDAVLSDANLAHPRLAAVVPMQPRITVIVGAGGQLGRALLEALPDAVALSRAELDITDRAAVQSFDWQGVGAIVNAAAWTAVDAAEIAEGRRKARAVNVDGGRNLVDVAARSRITLVQVSSDHVFDGVAEMHAEDEPFGPLSVYGATKAAGDSVVMTLPNYYVVHELGNWPDLAHFSAHLSFRSWRGDRVQQRICSSSRERNPRQKRIIERQRVLSGSDLPHGGSIQDLELSQAVRGAHMLDIS